MKLNHSQAARAAGITRKTLYTHVEKGKVSQEQDDEGNPLYDVSELMRVYPELNMDAVDTTQDKAEDTTQPETPSINRGVHPEIEALKEELEGLRTKAYEADKFRELYEQEKQRRERAERQEDESRELIKTLHRQLPAPAEAQAQPPRRKILGIF